MRIAQIAPLAESVPPKLYGGTERVVAWLTDALIEEGHEVTLFASVRVRRQSLFLFALVHFDSRNPARILLPHRQLCSKQWHDEQVNLMSSMFTLIGCICRSCTAQACLF